MIKEHKTQFKSAKYYTHLIWFSLIILHKFELKDSELSFFI